MKIIIFTSFMDSLCCIRNEIMNVIENQCNVLMMHEFIETLFYETFPHMLPGSPHIVYHAFVTFEMNCYYSLLGVDISITKGSISLK